MCVRVCVCPRHTTVLAFLLNKSWQWRATCSTEAISAVQVVWFPPEWQLVETTDQKVKPASCSPTCCCSLSEAKRNALQDYQKSDGVRLVAAHPDSSHLTKSRKVSMAKCAKACSRSGRLPFTCRYVQFPLVLVFFLALIQRRRRVKKRWESVVLVVLLPEA